MAEPTDITFKICNVRVNCRAVAIILNEGNILFQKRETDPVWALPGGKIAVLEKGKDTINRELNEEIGEPVEVSNLYDVEENFFDGVEKKKHLKFAWFNKEELDIYNVVPIEIKAALKEIIDANEQNVVKSKIRR